MLSPKRIRFKRRLYATFSRVKNYGSEKMGKKRKMPRATQIRIKAELEPEELSKHGYRMRASALSRHRALASAVQEDGAFTVHKRLNLLYVWNKSDDPDLAKIARADRNWVKHTYYGTPDWRA